MATPIGIWALGATLLTVAGAAPARTAEDLVIIHAPGAQPLEILAAREVQRYLYLRTGRLFEIDTARPPEGDALVLATDPDAHALDAFSLRTSARDGARTLRIAGGSPAATLYGAYRFAEHLGVRFALEGDIVPDERTGTFVLPDIDESMAPLFALRGIQPFHDFPEGPDWWSGDDYRLHLSQLAKLRMNFLGLHCYPEGHAGPEPLVWIGLERDIAPDGSVEFSSPSRWASTRGGAWGYADVPTSEFAAGASLLFAGDEFGPAVTEGHRPVPAAPEGCNEVFNRAGRLLGAVVEHAHSRGVRVCVGTETPLTIPAAVRERVASLGMDPDDPRTVRALYAGMFTRLQRVAPIDWYWLWTPEDWTWRGASDAESAATIADIHLASEALERVGDPFGLATCGWVLGPPGNRALFDRELPPEVALSCINRDVGFDPVEPGFARVDGRPAWAIPWMEDDPALIIPQLWAGRMRRDAADALAYGCDGLIGIHWRTRAIGPNVAALAGAAWDQSGWNPDLGRELPAPEPAITDVHVGGAVADYPASDIAATDEDRVYQTCRWNVDAYRVDVPAGRYDVTLKFCEVHHREIGKRVFGVKLQGEQLVQGLDVFARVGADAPLDLRFTGVEVGDRGLLVEFTREVEFPFIAGIVVRSADAGEGLRPPVVRRINCGGGAFGAYEADLPAIGSFASLLARPRDLPASDFYEDWARAQFGDAAAPALAAMFTRLDGSPREWRGRASNLPRPSDWDHGPGGIKVSREPWRVERERYAFVEEMESLRDRVVGEANLERFDYWLNSFRALRAAGEIGCARGRLDAAVERIAGAPDGGARRAIAADEAMPVRLELARLWERLMTLHLAIVSTPGELGTIANLEQHVRRGRSFLSLHDALLEEILGPLPPDAHPSPEFRGEPRIIVPTARADAVEGEALALRVILLDDRPAASAELLWRQMGEGEFLAVPLTHAGRAVYEATLPPASGSTIEYFIRATTADGVGLRWPPGAPRRNHTVVPAPRPLEAD